MCRGTNIVAVKTKMLAPDMVFKKIPQYKYDNIDPNQWYPMKQFTLLTDYIEQVHNPLVLVKIGRAIIPEMKEANILPDMPVEAFLKSLPDVYLQGNKGPDIGNWFLVSEEPKHFIL